MTDFNESKLSKIIARRIIAPTDRSQLLPLCTPIFCPDYKGVRASKVTIINPNTNSFITDEGTPGVTSIGVDSTKTPFNLSNTFDVDLNIAVRRTYFVPHEVDLETDVNLMDMIKSDFGVVFKKAVSQELLNQLEANSGSITTLTMGNTIAATIGSVIADNITNGTGQKYSIYKYDNGAPVTSIKSSSQPDIDDMVLEPKSDSVETIDNMSFKRVFATKDDVAVPAMYFVEQPTLIFDANKFEEYQQGLCSGTIKEYANKVVNVETTKQGLGALGEGVFGTNDTFAVAFTEPKITRIADKNYFADNICIEVYFGVTLVHTNNVRILV